MEIFNLLNNTLPENVPLQAWEKAYDKLAGVLFRERSTVSDREELYNALCYASTELKSLRERHNNSKKKRTEQDCF
ncbi:MAG: hypothetical protein LBP83_08240 [Dysgonamonadaceae bacterium]|jgi:hypothetical protein|nr:hypothetical protein [Dysgonamonadaceae bacterium]